MPEGPPSAPVASQTKSITSSTGTARNTRITVIPEIHSTRNYLKRPAGEGSEVAGVIQFGVVICGSAGDRAIAGYSQPGERRSDKLPGRAEGYWR